MIDDMAVNTHLGKQAAKLLKYYAECKGGFRPALAEIQKHTGIAPNKVSEIRQQLKDRTVIFFHPQKKIIINWKTIRLFAGLPEPLPLRGDEYRFMTLPPQGKKITIGSMISGKLHDCSGGIGNFFKYLRGLTLDEYRVFSRTVLGMEPPLELQDSDKLLTESYEELLDRLGITAGLLSVSNEQLPF